MNCLIPSVVAPSVHTTTWTHKIRVLGYQQLVIHCGYCLPYCSYLTVEWRAKKHDLPPKLFDGMRASYPGVREGEGREESVVM